MSPVSQLQAWPCKLETTTKSLLKSNKFCQGSRLGFFEFFLVVFPKYFRLFLRNSNLYFGDWPVYKLYTVLIVVALACVFCELATFYNMFSALCHCTVCPHLIFRCFYMFLPIRIQKPSNLSTILSKYTTFFYCMREFYFGFWPFWEKTGLKKRGWKNGVGAFFCLNV